MIYLHIGYNYLNGALSNVKFNMKKNSYFVQNTNIDEKLLKSIYVTLVSFKEFLK